MAQENESENFPTSSQPPATSGNVSERVQNLRRKASDLSETLDHVEKTLDEVGEESKE
jgi:hypothetical protein